MIIDIHSHLFVEEWLPKEFWDGIVITAVNKAKKIMGAEVSFEEMADSVLPDLWDPSGEILLEEMENAGIDKTVILPQDFEIGLSKTKVTIEEQNRIHAELMKKYPDRLVAFAGVDPRRENCLDFIEKCIKEWRMRGLKLHPGTDFFPDDKSLYPVYEKCLGLKIPVLFHSGPIMYPLRSKPAHPVYLDGVATDFPDLTIIVAHMSHGWWRDLLAIASVKQNLFVDISGWEMEAMSCYDNFCKILRKFIDELGSERMLFGTDGPGFRSACPPVEYLRIIRELPERSKGIKFKEEEILDILGRNAESILGL